MIKKREFFYTKNNNRDNKMKMEDLKKIIICCSSCDTPLIEFWITKPNKNIITEVIVNCAACGDKSFKKEIKGKYHLGNIENGKVRCSNFKLKLFDKNNKTVSHTDFSEEVKQILLVETINAN